MGKKNVSTIERGVESFPIKIRVGSRWIGAAISRIGEIRKFDSFKQAMASMGLTESGCPYRSDWN